MDRLARYRILLEDRLREFQRLYNLQPTPGVEAHCVFDEDRGHYLLIDLGWAGKKRVKRTILYARIVEGKVLIEDDWTEQGLANELLATGVPSEDIILAFQHPFLRSLPETREASLI